MAIYAYFLIPVALLIFILTKLGISGVTEYVVIITFSLILAASLQHFMNSRQSYRGRVLLLRKFHIEKPPRFPVSYVVSRLATIGFEPITLADSIITDDVFSKIPFSNVFPAVVGVTCYRIIAFFTTLIICRFIFGITKESFYANISSKILVFFTLLFVYIIGVLPTLRKKSFAERFTTVVIYYLGPVLVAITPRLVIRSENKNRKDLDEMVHHRLRKPWTLGITVITSSDQHWHYLVESLINTSSLICVDLSAPSPHIHTEISILSKLRKGSHIIWVHQVDSILSDLIITDDTYSLFGIDFDGPFKEFLYPSVAPPEMYNQFCQPSTCLNDQFLGLVSQFPESWPILPKE